MCRGIFKGNLMDVKDLTKEQQEQINEHYHNPKNMGALEEYNARGVGRNPDNWGQVDMYLQVDDNENIEAFGYEFKGCPTIAYTASVFTEELKGEALAVALKNTQAELDVLNAQSNCDDCIKMILVAFIAAYENYHERKKGTNEEDFSFKMIETTVPYTQEGCG
jgi:NifU-like protein involved in Fe-S cluster formation